MADTLGEKLFDLEARIEGVFPLAVGDPDGTPEWFRDFCEDCDSTSMAVFQRFKSLEPLIEGHEYPTVEEVAETLCNDPTINGWVCRIAWCPRKYLDSNIYRSGWGLTRSKWVWGQTADDAVAAALVFVSDCHAVSRPSAA